MKGVIAIIPSRYSSTRFPGKPLAFINGKMMIQRVYERAILSGCFDKVIIATDDKRIADASSSFGADFIMTSKKHKSGTDRVAEAARKFKDVQIVVNIQGDEPLISPETIKKVVKVMIDNPEINIATPVCISYNRDDFLNPNIGKVVFDKNYNALYFSRSLIPYSAKCFYKTFGLYAYRIKFLFNFINMKKSYLESIEKLEQLRILENGYRIRVVPVKDDSIPVDVPGDIKKVEIYLKKRGIE